MAVIGIAPSHRLGDYEAALDRVGAAHRRLDLAQESPDAIVRSIDGLLLTGGADVDPRHFGEAPHATFREAEPDRDEREMALVRAALEADLPILAVCRGLQVMNVACGGTLVQDIPSMVTGARKHQVDVPPFAIAHEIWVARGSLIWGLMQESLDGGDTGFVNSRHHQSARDLAPGFVASATAPDGVVEAIERPESSFCLGVQWHPENFYRTGEFRPLFEGLLEAARRRSAQR